METKDQKEGEYWTKVHQVAWNMIQNERLCCYVSSRCVNKEHITFRRW